MKAWPTAATLAIAMSMTGGCRDDAEPRAGAELPPLATNVAPEPVAPAAVPVANRLWIAPVVDEDPILVDLETVVSTDPAASSAGVAVERDRWSHRGVSHAVVSLRASDRAGLASYLGDLQVRHPELAPGPGQAYVFEAISDGDARGWKSHLVDQGRVLSPTAVSSIQVQENAVGSFELRVTLLPTDGEAFAALTESIVGHRMAIVIGDRAVSVATVAEPIVGGTLVITPGAATDPVRARTESEALARALRGE